jgi:ribose/xylose/arabinose/galactoside ABC-type transport system permease subunit
MRKELGIFVLLIVLCMIVSIINPRFLGPANLQNMGRFILMYGIFSIGLGIVIITGGIDLSVGSIFALLGVLLSLMLTEWHWPSALAVISVVVGAMGLGCLHGFLVHSADFSSTIMFPPTIRTAPKRFIGPQFLVLNGNRGMAMEASTELAKRRYPF